MRTLALEASHCPEERIGLDHVVDHYPDVLDELDIKCPPCTHYRYFRQDYDCAMKIIEDPTPVVSEAGSKRAAAS